MDTYLSDNSGNRVAPTPMSLQPLDPATTVQITDATIGGDANVTVVAGAMYVATYVAAFADAIMGMTFGTLDCTTVANIKWVCTPYESCVIKIPAGVTALHYNGLVNGASILLRRIYQ